MELTGETASVHDRRYTMVKHVSAGDTITVHYTGKYENGDIFDTSVGGVPFKFTVGTGHIIKGFDDAVLGMKESEKKTVMITPDKSYGAWRDDLVIDIPQSQIPPDTNLEKGAYIPVIYKTGKVYPALVVEICDDYVKLDLNNSLVGETLIFEIEIVETGLEPDLFTCAGGLRRRDSGK